MHSSSKTHIVISYVFVAIVCLVWAIHGKIINKSSTSDHGIGSDGVRATASPPVDTLAVEEKSTTTTAFRGYYTRREFPGADGIGPYTCPALAVRKTEDPLFQYFSALVIQGNTVNSLDEQGNLVMTLDMDNLSSQIVQKIVKSKREYPVEVQVQKLAQWGKDAPPCYSFVRVLSVR